MYQRAERPPGRLLDADLIHDAGEDGALLGAVDLLGVRPQHIDAPSVKRQRQVVRYLTPDRDDGASTLLWKADMY